MSIELIILKLQSVRASTRSEANKQLLTECIEGLTDMLREKLTQETTKQQFYVTQRLRLKRDGSIKLSEEGKKVRLLVNTIDEPNKRLWVVDAAGREKPQWVPMHMVEPAED